MTNPTPTEQVDSVEDAEVARVVIDVDSRDLATDGGVVVKRVEIRHELGRPSSVVVDTDDADALTLDVVDGGAVQEGRPVTVSLGLGESTAIAFTGEITGLEVELDNEDAARASIRGYDRMHRLVRGRRTRAFVDQSDSTIAAAVAKEHGLTLEGPDSKEVHPYVMQREQTDLAFLLERARPLGRVVRVEGTRLLFTPRDLKTDAVMTAEMGTNLLTVRVSSSVLGLVGTVEARGWDPDEQKALSAKVAESKLASLMGGAKSGPKIADTCFAAQTTVVTDDALITAPAVELAAAAALEDMALGHVTCRGRMLGAAELRPGALIAVKGIGARFEGNYWLTRVVHTYDQESFTTEFEGRRTAS